jgi:hypothetical protein
MKKQMLPQTSMQAGELDPRARMRLDIVPWRNGVKKMRNMRPLLHGGAKTRPPLQFIRDAQGDGILIPFVFSATQAYVFHLKANDLRIFYEDGTVAVSSIVMPYSAAEISRVRWTQSGDTIIFFHIDYVPRILLRTGTASFALSLFSFDSITAGGQAIPFYRYEASTVTLTPSATTGTITITANSPIFASTWVNDRIRIREKQVRLTVFTSATVMSGVVEQTLLATAATAEWDEQAFSARRGYPGCGAFHDERLALAGAKTRLAGIWLSKVGAYFNFDIGTGLDSQAIWSGLSSDKVNVIEHLVSHRNLLVLGDFGEAYVPQSETKPITPGNFTVRPQTPFGTMAEVRPSIFDEAVFTAQRFGQGIRELLYVEASTAYSADSVSTLAAHLINQPVCIESLTTNPDIKEQYLFVVLADGSMSVLHSLRNQKITAWCNWTTPNGLFKSVCNVNGKIYVLVLRYGTQWCLERFRFDLEEFALDSFSSSVAGSSVTGLAHLNTRSVGIVSNKQFYGNGVVSGGSVAVDPVTVATTYAGLIYSPLLESLPPETQDDSGSTIGRKKRMSKVSLNIFETVRIGVNGYNLEVRDVRSVMSDAPALKTGTYDFSLLGWKTDPTFTLSSDVPLPITVLGFGAEISFRNEQ